jgi:hypothetical protein
VLVKSTHVQLSQQEMALVDTLADAPVTFVSTDRFYISGREQQGGRVSYATIDLPRKVELGDND